MREILIPRLQENGVKKFGVQPILEKIFILHETQPEFGFHELQGRLEERELHLVTNAIFADTSSEMFTAEQAMAYVAVLEAEGRQARITILRTRLKEAERSGNLDEAFRLMAELGQMQRS